MERYKTKCDCGYELITYESEWADGEVECIRCRALLTTRELFPFVRRKRRPRPERTKKQREQNAKTGGKWAYKKSQNRFKKQYAEFCRKHGQQA